jgi:hypothetical protein
MLKVNKENNIVLKEELEKIIEHWNKIFSEDRRITKILLDEYIRIRKEYSFEDFKL